MNIFDKVEGLKEVEVGVLMEKYYVGVEKDVVKKLSFVKSGLYKIELGSRGIWENIELVEDEVNVCVDGREVYDEECEEMYEDEEYENEFYGEIGYFDEGYMFGYNEEGVDYFVRVLVN